MNLKRHIKYQEELDKLNLEPGLAFSLSVMYPIVEAIKNKEEPYKIYKSIINKIDG